MNGDPSTTDRVSGQLYYDVTTGHFKGIDGTGAVQSLTTSPNPWSTSGSNIYYSTGAVGIGGAPGTPGLDIQTPSAGIGLVVRHGTTGTDSAFGVITQFATGVTDLQGTNSTLTSATTLEINGQGGDVIIAGGGGLTTITGNVRMAAFGAGTCTFDASGNVSSSSDERLKTDIQPFQTGLSALSKINPIRYKWNAKSGMETEHEYVGFSAQNVQSALPEGVGMNPKGYLSLQERAIIATLVNSVKELQSEVQQLKDQKGK